MHAGLLRHRAEFQSFAKSRNEYGEEELSWQTYYVCNVSLRPISQTEEIDGGTTVAKTRFQIGMRFRAGVKSKDRIKIGSRYFSIISVLDTENRGRELTLVATEEDSNGDEHSRLA